MTPAKNPQPPRPLHMPKTRRIVLLTQREEAPVFMDWLRDRAPDVDLIQARDLSMLQTAIGGAGDRTRVISMLSHVIIPAHLLDLLGPEPYNIHPGPPEYPGANPERRALDEGASDYGVTGHVMVEQLDAGPIIYVNRFEIPPGIARLEFADQVFAHTIRAFGLIAAHCALTNAPLARVNADWAPRLTHQAELAAQRQRNAKLAVDAASAQSMASLPEQTPPRIAAKA